MSGKQIVPRTETVVRRPIRHAHVHRVAMAFAAACFAFACVGSVVLLIMGVSRNVWLSSVLATLFGLQAIIHALAPRSWPGCTIRSANAGDREWILRVGRDRWGGETIVSRGRAHRLDELPAFVAEVRQKLVGLATYRIEGDQCELVSLDSLRPRLGVGGHLLDAVRDAARQAGCRRLWLVTTNDNTDALRFYQKRGMRIAAVHRNALAATRALKPALPATGSHGIPLRDEIELEEMLEPPAEVKPQSLLEPA